MLDVLYKGKVYKLSIMQRVYMQLIAESIHARYNRITKLVVVPHGLTAIKDGNIIDVARSVNG